MQVDETTVGVHIQLLRQHQRKLIRAEVARTVLPTEDIEAELACLLSLFRSGG